MRCMHHTHEAKITPNFQVRVAAMEAHSECAAVLGAIVETSDSIEFETRACLPKELQGLFGNLFTFDQQGLERFVGHHASEPIAFVEEVEHCSKQALRQVNQHETTLAPNSRIGLYIRDIQIQKRFPLHSH